MNTNPEKRRLILEAILCGVLLTVVLTFLAFITGSREWACIYVWQACLVQLVLHTPDNPVHEATLIDAVAFFFGVLLGVPIYSLLSYVALSYCYKKEGMK